MTRPTQLVIRLRVDGTVDAETRNVTGADCVPFAAILEDLCDSEAIESGYTADYYAVVDAEERQLAEVDERDDA